MKNYTYGRVLRDRGYVEIPEENYTDRQKDMCEYIKILSEAVSKAKCGWSGVRYAVMQYTDDSIEKYMVLWVRGGGERWIPITGNSKGACLSDLADNLW
jgi:hypothetical protein